MEYNTTPLFISTKLLNFTGSHPLTRSVHPRISRLESILLASPPARLLLRFGFSHSAVSLIGLIGGLGGLIRGRRQWRFFLTCLGVGEAITRTVSVLDALEETDSREQEDETRKKWFRDEVKHLASFWLVFALLELLESVQRMPPTQPRRWRPPLAFRRLMHRLSATYKRLNLPKVQLWSTLAAPKPTAFPQPTPFVTSTSGVLRRTPLPFTLFPSSSEVIYRLFKTFVLLNSLRKQGFGASSIWEWLIRPFVVVSRSRNVGYPKRRVIVVEDDGTFADGDVEEGQDVTFSPISLGHASEDPTESVESSSHGLRSRDPSPSPSPTKAARHAASYPKSNQQQQQQLFPTPNHIPYRLTSSSHPIHARSRSRGSSAVSGEAGHDDAAHSQHSGSGPDVDLTSSFGVAGEETGASWTVESGRWE
ncbi:hypothetical protein T439DRAFT_323452 [Meredithblackwellia eburnea MCA 4105]